MVNVRMVVESGASTFPTGCIRWVYEERRVGFFLVFGNNLERVALDELDPGCNEFNVGDTLRDGLRIPARQNSLAVAMFENTCAIGENSSMRSTVLNDGLEGEVAI